MEKRGCGYFEVTPKSFLSNFWGSLHKTHFVLLDYHLGQGRKEGSFKF